MGDKLSSFQTQKNRDPPFPHLSHFFVFLLPSLISTAPQRVRKCCFALAKQKGGGGEDLTDGLARFFGLFRGRHRFLGSEKWVLDALFLERGRTKMRPNIGWRGKKSPLPGTESLKIGSKHLGKERKTG